MYNKSQYKRKNFISNRITNNKLSPIICEVKWVPVVAGLGGIVFETVADAQKTSFR